jgi:hypothetical protein
MSAVEPDQITSSGVRLSRLTSGELTPSLFQEMAFSFQWAYMAVEAFFAPGTKFSYKKSRKSQIGK